jgi:hypothetical protein
MPAKRKPPAPEKRRHPAPAQVFLLDELPPPPIIIIGRSMDWAGRRLAFAATGGKTERPEWRGRLKRRAAGRNIEKGSLKGG